MPDIYIEALLIDEELAAYLDLIEKCQHG